MENRKNFTCFYQIAGVFSFVATKVQVVAYTEEEARQAAITKLQSRWNANRIQVGVVRPSDNA